MKSLFPFAGILAGAILAVPALNAGSLASPCVAGTLATYEDSLAVTGGPFVCSVGIDNFTGFTSSGGLDATNVEITPVPASGDGGGFMLSALNSSVFTVAAGDTATYDVDWSFVVDVGPQADAASLGMDPPIGNVTITQEYCTDALFNSDGVCESRDIQSLAVSAPPCFSNPVIDPADCMSTLAFQPLLDSAGVKTIITLNGVDTLAGSSFDSLTGTASNINPAPEPATYSAALGGLLLMATGLRRRYGKSTA
jgi:hypothetical protein